MTINAVTQFTINFPGENNIIPRIGHLYSKTNTLAEISAAGFLDQYIKSQGMSVLATDVVLCVGTDGTQFYKPVFTNTSCRLTALP